ncbi:GspE/PulE family protein [Desulfobacula toluolica]|uniref:GspE: general secretion pathway protein E n=1 Tax=Desulfobacula toluolica (strain DSM 7467 / Tol2) TaxID=651182 RepID=K0NEK3_DESTT|nr:GspE/PulE family protein [Desulfobacula toluolica]CCK79496.1 GspE: general secretion pathway protein E [Desulfobacula toluolica Tol2]
MQNQTDKRFASQTICKILMAAKLISAQQARDLLKNENRVKNILIKQKTKQSDKDGSKGHIAAPVCFVDVILYMKIERKDQPSLIIDEDLIYQTLAQAWKVPYKKIDPLKLELNLVTGTISKSFAAKYLLLPLKVEEGKLIVATPDPFNYEAIKDVEMVSKLKVKTVVSSKSDIEKLINEFFGFQYSISAAADLFSTKGIDIGNLEQFVSLKSFDELPSTDQHIVNAVNHLFSYAFDQKASDIHIEPKRDICLIRMRIDGVLNTVYKLPKKLHNAVVSRIKTLSRLDMAEKRRPQDGRIKIEQHNKEVEIRVSTIPVAFGEKVVLRIMDPDVLFQDLEMLGFFKDDFERYKQLITRPFGIVLVTGPTGSGKSTTLYSSLKMLSSPEVNITTIEDPIEMIHEEFNQIAVQPMINVTFDSVLRNILRQDPDIIMVGEIRDLETAQAAVQAALTGHLVLSTLHTNDAASTIFRLLDLGIPPYLVHSSLNGIVAQRLVRKICPYCAQEVEMDAKDLAELGLNIKSKGMIRLKHGKGCVKCRNTGYKGRTGIYEIMPYTDALKRLTTSDVQLGSLRKKAIEEGLVLVRQNGIKKMLKGQTTYQEILRVTWEQV